MRAMSKKKDKVVKAEALLDGSALAKYLFARIDLIVKQTKRGKRHKPLDVDRIVLELQKTMTCVNCDTDLRDNKSTLYCDDFCQQMVAVVRYVRKGLLEGKRNDPEFLIGVGDQLNHLPSGGYAKTERQLSKQTREAIFERDHRICQICLEKPATQIDHIAGSSSDHSNLQAVCADCNREKAFANRRPGKDEELKLIEYVYADLTARIAAPVASRLCDDHKVWDGIWRKIQAFRRKTRKELLTEIDDEDDDGWEDVDGYLAHVMEKDD